MLRKTISLLYAIAFFETSFKKQNSITAKTIAAQNLSAFLPVVLTVSPVTIQSLLHNIKE